MFPSDRERSPVWGGSRRFRWRWHCSYAAAAVANLLSPSHFANPRFPARDATIEHVETGHDGWMSERYDEEIKEQLGVLKKLLTRPAGSGRWRRW
jgi:glutathione S-transferase